MTRSYRLVVAVLATLAITVSLGAASASAARIATEVYPANLSGAATTSTNFNLAKITTTCTNSTFQASLSKAGQVVSGEPQFSGCSYYAGSILVNANGCKLEFHPESGTVNIGPAGCGPITVTTGSSMICRQTIPSQTALASVEYGTVGSGSGTHVTINAHITGMSYTSEGANCGSVAKGTDGRLDVSWDLRATNLGGSAIAAFLESASGFQVTGGSTPQFTAEVLPAVFTGKQDAANKHRFVTGAAQTECSSVSIPGEISAPTSEFIATPTYTGCKLTVFGSLMDANVNMNGCAYKFTVTSSNPYAGTLKLVCPSGQSMQIVTTAGASGCEVRIPPQTLGSVTYQNTFGTNGRSVIASASGTGLSYTTSGFVCGTSSGTNGKFTGGTVFH